MDYRSLQLILQLLVVGGVQLTYHRDSKKKNRLLSLNDGRLTLLSGIIFNSKRKELVGSSREAELQVKFGLSRSVTVDCIDVLFFWPWRNIFHSEQMSYVSPAAN